MFHSQDGESLQLTFYWPVRKRILGERIYLFDKFSIMIPVVDVVIGAPYEDGGGAVYIYYGAQNGINLEKKARQVKKAMFCSSMK